MIPDLKSFLVGAIVVMSFITLIGSFAAGCITANFAVFYELGKDIVISGLVGGAIGNLLAGSHKPTEPQQ